MNDAIAWTTVLGGLVVVAGFLGAVVHRLRKRLGGLTDFIDDWNGEGARPGVPARPGVMARLASIEEQTAVLPAVQQRIAAVEHELKPNSGGSLRDAVDRVEAHTARIAPDSE